MTRLRDYALVAGFGLSLCGGFLLSFRPGSVGLALTILVPGMALFLWGLLANLPQEA